MRTPTVSRTMAEVLGLLLQAWQEGAELHGWLIMRGLRRSGPAVYAALDQLEDAGWTTASWEALPAGENRARRRYYRLTASGVEAARQHAIPVETERPRWWRPQPGFGMAAR
ncbi:DNA-binding PadR family transcriptional regulator [Catenuloplanes nepalensis]|uniref:DNA-binding PadR family transcriptional regulator n=1 Tax=Catenuloplanes nepalensis TaxID=587533 RepID=A0ABT9MQA8_9ACTN|nr:PadR family transcriptional regulator [Catenuloplanes nepalensis]MDP9793486.1 DNA-binding PadR family transcriptional regulator [Catenuloplanes nepalensis]